LGKKLLIAVDNSIHSKRAMAYAAAMGSLIKELRYVLFHVQPKISEFLVEDSKTDAKAIATLRRVDMENRSNSKKILEKAKAFMTKKSVDDKKIETVSQPYRRGTAKSILDYGVRTRCDAIVLGRRGLSRLAESFVGSVANSVLEYTKTMPVWSIGGESKSQRIMVAIDGSESSLRALDHVCYMTGGNPSIEINLLHVAPRLRDYCSIDFEADEEILEEIISREDKKCIDGFYVHAKRRFKNAGIEESRILIREVESAVSVGKTVVNEANKGEFGAIVVGRSGLNKSFFMGSVSQYILNGAPKSAVWLVP